MATIPSSQKTFSVNEGVNTVYGGSASMKALSQWYTMQDITDTVRPYKVYTVLMSQGSPAELDITSGQAQKGVTYSLDTESSPGEWDFSNIGGPKSPETWDFISNDTKEPLNWGGVVLNYNSGAPVITETLENTVGNILWYYNDIGYFTGELANGFAGSVFYNNTNNVFLSKFIGLGLCLMDIYAIDENSIGIDISKASGSYDTTNGALVNTPIEIRVYN
jgi:hypothetical protein